MNCNKCDSKHTSKSGIHVTTKGKFQRYHCLDCGRVFIGEQLLAFKMA